MGQQLSSPRGAKCLVAHSATKVVLITVFSHYLLDSFYWYNRWHHLMWLFLVVRRRFLQWPQHQTCSRDSQPPSRPYPRHSLSFLADKVPGPGSWGHLLWFTQLRNSGGRKPVWALGVQQHGIQKSDWALVGCVALGRSPNLSGPQSEPWISWWAE